MAGQSQKHGDSTTVRIYKNPKARLQKVVRARALKENRNVTEAELASEAVEVFCAREERKLGITEK